MKMTALQKLAAAQGRTGSLLSIGLEPSLEYLPGRYPRTLDGYREFLVDIIEASAAHVAAFKINVAFFESHGWQGVRMMYDVREAIPDDVLLIADAKRGDIGSTAKHYARSIFDELAADAVTLNPLMGRDSAQPFLDYTDRLCFFLVLTSNPGAKDFLLQDGLYTRIARTIAGEWNEHHNCGFVTGATRPEQVGELRAIAPKIPFLVPGIGAQGGALEETMKHGQVEGKEPGLLFHATRGILPALDDEGHPRGIIYEKVKSWNDRIAAAAAQAL